MHISRIILLLLPLTLCSPNSELLNQFLATMPHQPKEMDKIILQDFVSEGVTATDLDQIREKFEVFRREWVERMIDYLLKELGINEEGAR